MDNLTPAPASNLPPQEGWAVAAGRGADWWRVGWTLFLKSPWVWIAITIVSCVIVVILNFVPFVGSIAVSLLYPMLLAGVLLGAREQDRGGVLRFDHLFAGFGAKATPLFILSLLIFAGWFVIWMVVAGALLSLFGFGTLASMMSGDVETMGFGMLAAFGMGLVVALLIAALLSVPLLMATWFAPALVVFRGDEPVAALKASFFACLRNMPPFLVYGLIGIVLAVVATIPFGLGWLVLMPVSMGSIYASYKDVFGEPA